MDRELLGPRQRNEALIESRLLFIFVRDKPTRLRLQDIHGLARGDVQLGVTRSAPGKVGHAVRHLYGPDVLAVAVIDPDTVRPGDEEPAMFVDPHSVRIPAASWIDHCAEDHATGDGPVLVEVIAVYFPRFVVVDV